EPEPPRVAEPPLIALIDVATDLNAAVAKAPSPPAMPLRIDDAPGASPHLAGARPHARSPSLNVRAPALSPPDPRTRLEERFVNAARPVGNEARRLRASTEGKGPPMANGSAEFTYGRVAGDGTGTSPVVDPRAGLRGKDGRSKPPPPPAPDRSRAASVFM